MLLPHGYEGQGPEHSSARLERFLQLCAQNNMHVAVPSTPAQIFHLLRLQMHRENRLPLIVMSPKSLLRNPKAVSSLEDIATGRFMPVLDDPNPVLDAEKVVLCSGKVFYDLQEMRDEHQLQLHSFVLSDFTHFQMMKWQVSYHNTNRPKKLFGVKKSHLTKVLGYLFVIKLKKLLRQISICATVVGMNKLLLQ